MHGIDTISPEAAVIGIAATARRHVVSKSERLPGWQTQPTGVGQREKLARAPQLCNHIDGTRGVAGLRGEEFMQQTIGWADSVVSHRKWREVKQ